MRANLRYLFLLNIDDHVTPQKIISHFIQQMCF
jgi:hypothetical protein